MTRKVWGQAGKMNLGFLGNGRVRIREGYPWFVLAINPCNIQESEQKRKFYEGRSFVKPSFVNP